LNQQVSSFLSSSACTYENSILYLGTLERIMKGLRNSKDKEGD
jgi:hypothetical protein